MYVEYNLEGALNEYEMLEYDKTMLDWMDVHC